MYHIKFNIFLGICNFFPYFSDYKQLSQCSNLTLHYHWIFSIRLTKNILKTDREIWTICSFTREDLGRQILFKYTSSSQNEQDQVCEQSPECCSLLGDY